jgi:hypothetical protein
MASERFGTPGRVARHWSSFAINEGGTTICMRSVIRSVLAVAGFLMRGALTQVACGLQSVDNTHHTDRLSSRASAIARGWEAAFVLLQDHAAALTTGQARLCHAALRSGPELAVRAHPYSRRRSRLARRVLAVSFKILGHRQ